MDAPLQPLNTSTNPPAASPPTPSPVPMAAPAPVPYQAPVPPKPPTAPTPPPVPTPKPPAPPVAPWTPPPAPKPVMPPPAPMPKPATPPPAPPRPTAPMSSPSLTPLPPKEHHWLRWILTLALLFALGVLAYLFAWPMLQKTQTPPTPPAVIQTQSPTPPPSETSPPSPVATTTPVAATTTVPAQPTTPKAYGGLDVYKFGDKVQLFTGDQVAFSDDVTSNRALKVSVTGFTDSRCHAGAQCVWAGEQGVNLHVIHVETGQEQDVYLGLVRAKTATVFGHLFTLNEIDEGKGGIYAEIRVE